MHPDTSRIALYAAIIFVSSALLLVLEIVAARLIAPCVGLSLYTWSAVIGVILARLPPDERFDIIVGDAFHDVSVPYHLVTQEFADLLQQRLTADGIYVLNLVDVHPDGHLVAAMRKTLLTVFPYVDVWLHELPNVPARVTYVLSASRVAAESTGAGEYLHAVTRPARSWVRVTGRTAGGAGVPLLTDDNAPVEQLISTLFTTDVGR